MVNHTSLTLTRPVQCPTLPHLSVVVGESVPPLSGPAPQTLVEPPRLRRRARAAAGGHEAAAHFPLPPASFEGGAGCRGGLAGRGLQLEGGQLQPRPRSGGLKGEAGREEERGCGGRGAEQGELVPRGRSLQLSEHVGADAGEAADNTGGLPQYLCYTIFIQ